MITAEQLRNAVGLVRQATAEFVEMGFFQRGVLARLDMWIHGLPTDRSELAKAITQLAGQWGGGTGADVNGVALNEAEKPSLESLVLHYAGQEPDLFPRPGVAAIREKLAPHGGPRYAGPWP